MTSLAETFSDRNIMKLSYTASGMIEYIGYASPGSASSAAVWKIIKMTYDGSGRQTDLQFADGSRNFDKIWDSKAGYTYK